MKIIVCYDDSNLSSHILSNHIVKQAQKHAQLYNGILEIVKAVCREEPFKHSRLMEMEEELESNIQKLFEDVDIPYNCQLNVDDVRVGDKIVDLAETMNADFIFLGIKKRSKVGKMLFGSTARSIVLHATCPVITFNRFQIPQKAL